MDYPEHSTGRDAPLFLMRTWSGSYVEPGRWPQAVKGWCERDAANVFLTAAVLLAAVAIVIPFIHLLAFGVACS